MINYKSINNASADISDNFQVPAELKVTSTIDLKNEFLPLLSESASAGRFRRNSHGSSVTGVIPEKVEKEA